MAKTRAKTSKRRTPSTTKKKSSKRRHLAKLPVATARAALDRATKDIKKLQKGASRNSWAIGRRLTQVAELELHKSRGYSSIEAYAEKVLRITRDTAFLYMRVAEAFSETMAESFGTEKLDRALRYIAATPEDEKPSDIPKLRFRIPSEDGNGTRTKSFEQVTIADLRRATQHERAGSRKAKEPPPKWLDEGAASALESGNTALDKVVGRNAGKTADVTVRRVGDEVLVDVRGVPLSKARAALSAIAKALK